MRTGRNPTRALARRLRWRRLVVRGESMRPALAPGDRVLVAPFVRLRPGDVVALHDPERPGALVVKRLARVADDVVVVLGDDEVMSVDSRRYGPVARRSVLGVVVYRYHPASRAGRVPRGTLPC